MRMERNGNKDGQNWNKVEQKNGTKMGTTWHEHSESFQAADMLFFGSHHPSHVAKKKTQWSTDGTMSSN